ncbi:hypothetical protein [Motilibacter aurantiacus]|uniref:hypothetical protein n=1 Tax=Motilibacter aurantiacus TaxID=2714955 RepID=UPI001E40D92D|nr:hypothetical protein [Motilibacter aurantiacus]
MTGLSGAPLPADAVLAHGIGGRQDLPIPFSYALIGAALALVLSFVLLGVLWRNPKLTGERAGLPLPDNVARVLDSPAPAWVLRVVGLVVTAWFGTSLLFGEDIATNPAPYAIFILLWIGIVPLSVLFGPVWRYLNPLRTLHALLATALRTRPEDGLYALSPRVGYWPAAVGLFAFVWLELVAPDRATLPVLRAWVAAYAGVHLICAAVFGSRWFDRGDAFEVYSAFFGKLSPLGRREDGRLVLRNPLDGMASLRPAPGLVAVVAVMLGSTAWDSYSGSTRWVSYAQQAEHRTLVGTLGLLGAVVLVGLVLVAAALLAGRLGHVEQSGRERVPLREVPGEFAHTIVPIALGYVVAHYYSLFVLEGQRTLILATDPVQSGADYLRLRDAAIQASFITPTSVSVIQVVAVVTGHVLGVVLAHDRGVRLFPHARAVAGQLPLLVVMVGYTCAGLALLLE